MLMKDGRHAQSIPINRVQVADFDESAADHVELCQHASNDTASMERDEYFRRGRNARYSHLLRKTE